MTEKSRTVNRWYATFVKGTDFDSWGQLVEAAEEYTRLARDLTKATGIENKMFQTEQKVLDVTHSVKYAQIVNNYVPKWRWIFTEPLWRSKYPLLVTDNEKLMMKIAICLENRSRTLLQSQSHDEDVEFTLDELRKAGEVLQNLMLGWNEPFPVMVEVPKPSSSEVCDYAEGNGAEFVAAGEGGTLMPRIPYEEGLHRLTVRVERIGLKDVSSYINCYLTVSVKDANSVNVTPPQDTPVSNTKDGNYILFGVNVEIQRTIERFPKGTAIFFEFKHYKSKKNLISTRCFAFMEQDELKSGSACIELYQKPTDFHRKKLNLLTKKPLYLHLEIIVHD